MPLTDSKAIADLLNASKTIAVVGASDKPDRASNGVMKFMQERGWRTIPVNPRLAGKTIHGEEVRSSLGEIGEPVDIVDIFRRSEDAGESVDEAIAAGAKAVWLQLGVVDEDAARRAEEAGLAVVMDHCIKIEAAQTGARPASA